MRPAYSYRDGVIYVVSARGELRPITMATAEAQLAAHKAGARDLRMGPRVAEVSAELAGQIEPKIEAAKAEIAERARLVAKPTPDQERQRLAAVRRARKAERQAKGMVG